MRRRMMRIGGIQTLRVLGKPSWGSSRRPVTSGVAIKMAQRARSRKSIFKLSELPWRSNLAL
ncbi:hypothetical protein DPMN_065138 [Dreissena polymorpha]|uniref:Uncharacterized protein n=1 Tax=Dreissena polymorpha TaxID=45954 RepID=A0A9D4CEG3_DREPO|nr:hypothetical protein DPMN_065138 [Dreissena polymorpha]